MGQRQIANVNIFLSERKGRCEKKWSGARSLKVTTVGASLRRHMGRPSGHQFDSTCGVVWEKSQGGLLYNRYKHWPPPHLLTKTYPRRGILSAIPVMPAMMLLWEIMTPLGSPVDPLVYMITAISEGAGVLWGLFSVLEKNTYTIHF